MLQENQKIVAADDLSAPVELPSYEKKFAEHDLQWHQSQIQFKRWLFYGTGLTNIFLVIALLGYIALPLFWPTQSIPLHERLMVIGILAAMTMVLSLALMRVVYLQSKTKGDTGDSVSIWQSLAKELLDILRKYVSSERS